ncbi:hypothetical protein QL983_11090 [Micrococcus sp. APC 4021]|uniref:hypothetical protein n=1 Tax=Micrococcus sp. APC 4021 TaxID=3035197 RepID=UPI0025B3EC09|nr:hypothetical protein [Micrococcus sp. APC 4021]MDN3469264.1 hypothetical protein [Micrococcus sp. APC 4021]
MVPPRSTQEPLGGTPQEPREENRVASQRDPGTRARTSTPPADAVGREDDERNRQAAALRAKYPDHEHRDPSKASEADGVTFDDFWDVYPRKVGKKAARAAWRAALREAPATDIVDGARRYAEDPNLPSGAEAQYVAHPSTWLHAGRWEDDPLPPRHASATGREPGHSTPAPDLSAWNSYTPAYEHDDPDAPRFHEDPLPL